MLPAGGGRGVGLVEVGRDVEAGVLQRHAVHALPGPDVAVL